jgi:hypothetical protein
MHTGRVNAALADVRATIEVLRERAGRIAFHVDSVGAHASMGADEELELVLSELRAAEAREQTLRLQLPEAERQDEAAKAHRDAVMFIELDERMFPDLLLRAQANPDDQPAQLAVCSMARAMDAFLTERRDDPRYAGKALKYRQWKTWSPRRDYRALEAGGATRPESHAPFVPCPIAKPWEPLIAILKGEA